MPGPALRIVVSSPGDVGQEREAAFCSFETPDLFESQLEAHLRRLIPARLPPHRDGAGDLFGGLAAALPELAALQWDRARLAQQLRGASPLACQATAGMSRPSGYLCAGAASDSAGAASAAAGAAPAPRAGRSVRCCRSITVHSRSRL